MIEQVIDKDGNIWDVKYPKDAMLSLSRRRCSDSGKAFTHTTSCFLSKLGERDYRPYKINGELSNDLEPWEYYSYDGAKEKWMAVKEGFESKGYTVTNSHRDMLIQKGGRSVIIPDCIVHNHDTEDVIRVEEEHWDK